MSSRYKPEVVLLHTPDISDIHLVLRSANVSEPVNLHSFCIDPAMGASEEERNLLVAIMEQRSLSHLIVQDRLMKPVIGLAKLAIGCASWYSPTQESFVFGTFDEDNNLTEVPLEIARNMAQFIEIPDLSPIDRNQN